MSDPTGMADAMRAAAEAAEAMSTAMNVQPDRHGRTIRPVAPPVRWSAKVGQQVVNRKSRRRAVLLAVRMVERKERVPGGTMKRVRVPRVVLMTETGSYVAVSPDALWQKWEPVNEAMLGASLSVVGAGGGGGGQDAQGVGFEGAPVPLPPLREVPPDQRPRARKRRQAGNGAGAE